MHPTQVRTHAKQSAGVEGRGEVEAPPREKLIDRRQVVAGAGGLAALATLWAPSRAVARAPYRRPRGDVVLDVACLGDTFAPDLAAALDAPAGDLRGAGFFVEGLIYRAGTIPGGPGFDPQSATAIGTWLCRGWFMLHSVRPLPHVISQQEYMLGIVSPQEPTPRDQLVTSGAEGGVPLAVRSVIGGTGRYRRARGEVAQHLIGTNTTDLNVIGEPAPNLRFVFNLEP
jgi:hypothetical protein